jgi:hypothetical protein
MPGRIYRFTPTKYPEDMKSVQKVLASININVITRDGLHRGTIVVPEAIITASAFVMQGLLDNMFIDSAEYREDFGTSQFLNLVRQGRTL